MAARHPRDVRMHDPQVHHLAQQPSTQHPPPAAPAQGPPPPHSTSIIHKLNVANEQTWLLIGRVAEQMGDLEHALNAYENALRHNPMSLAGLTQVAGIARIKENYPKAIEYFQRVVSLQEDNGEVWSALGHCYLMQDDLQKAYSAYQQALYMLPNPKEDPKLWYGIGILYDRYGSLDHAEEAFSSVLRMDKDFDKANEILFRLGIIYKQQSKYKESLDCFDRILRNPPSPLAHADIWFQIGHVYEQMKDYHQAKDAYERVVQDNPNHAKVLQQLGWLYHQDGSSFQNQDLAIQYLTKSLEADPSDAQSWYLLGRAYMAGQKYNKAYEAYQQAVYRDGRNPTFWCSIGVLYFQINQYRDALDAYSRAIRINPYISEVWFDLGSLYESCNNQITDAIDAYARASELDPGNPSITHRLSLLRQAQQHGTVLPAAPGPQDVHPTAYASAVVPPPGLNGPLSLGNQPRLGPRTESRGPSDALPPVNSGRGTPPFRGGPPPPVVIDDRHISSHPPLAPMEVDRPPHARDYPPSSRESHQRVPPVHPGSSSHGHGPSQMAVDDMRKPGPPPPPPHVHPDTFNRSRGPRSRSISPAPQSAHPMSPQQFYNGYPPQPRQPVGPAQPSGAPVQRSPRQYHPSLEQGRPGEREGWDHDRRQPMPPTDQRDWERDQRDRRPRHSGEFAPPPPMYQQSPPNPTHRVQSPPQPSPRPGNRYQQWEQKPPTAPHHPHGPSPPPPPPSADQRRYEREYSTGPYPSSPPTSRNVIRQTHPHMVEPGRRSESPHPSQSVDAKDRRRRARDSRDFESQQPLPPQPQQQPQTLPLQPPPVPQSATPTLQDPSSRKERRRRNGPRRPDGSETPKPEQQQQRSNSFKVVPGYPEGSNGNGSSNFRPMQPPYTKGPSSPEMERGRYSYSHAGSPEPINTGVPASRSVQPSPTIATPRPLARPIDEDYDNDSVDALMGLSQQYRGQQAPPSSATPSIDHASQSPTISPGSRTSDPSPRPPVSHRNSVSSTLSHASPSSQAAQLKRPRSPGSDESDTKRTRTESLRRRSSVSVGRKTPVQSTRPSPIPFRTQPPPSHSPENRQPHEYSAASPPLVNNVAVVLPPHPRPIGAGHGGSHGSSGLPPIATLSPQSSTAASPGSAERGGDERMQVDGSRSSSPQVRKGVQGGSEMGRPSSRTPPGTKHTPTPPVEKKEQL